MRVVLTLYIYKFCKLDVIQLSSYFSTAKEGFSVSLESKSKKKRDLKSANLYKAQIKTAKMRVWSLALVVVLLAALATPSPAPLGLKKG